jgi:hypothetical protein
MVSGGTIFEGTFKLPILTFLYIIVMLMVIALFLAIIFGLITFTASFFVPQDSAMVYGAIAIIYLFVSMYAPLDYVYTLGSR